MKLLAIDTAANLCAAAVFDTAAGVVLSEASEDIGKGHAEHLMAIIEAVLAAAGVGIHEIGKVAVTVGPGSFTGIRVGVAAARGLGLALGCPVVGVTTLEALAAEARERFPGRPVLAAIDARRGEIYAQGFDAAGRSEVEPSVLPLAEVAGRFEGRAELPVVAGSAAPLLREALGDAPLAVASEAATAPVGIVARIAAGRVESEAPRPLYLRAPDAKPQAGFAVERSGLP